MMALQIEDGRVEDRKTQKMGVPHVTSFCCCFGLEMGAKVVGYLHLIIAICLVVTCSIFASKFAARANTAEDIGDPINGTYHTITSVIAGISTGHCLLAVVLLYGVYKRNTLALRVWVLIMLSLVSLALLVLLVNVALTGMQDSGSEIFLAFLEGVIAFGLLAYAILCVNSYYLMLKSCEDMEGPTNTPY